MTLFWLFLLGSCYSQVSLPQSNQVSKPDNTLGKESSVSQLAIQYNGQINLNFNNIVIDEKQINTYTLPLLKQLIVIPQGIMKTSATFNNATVIAIVNPTSSSSVELYFGNIINNQVMLKSCDSFNCPTIAYIPSGPSVLIQGVDSYYIAIVSSSGIHVSLFSLSSLSWVSKGTYCPLMSKDNISLSSNFVIAGNKRYLARVEFQSTGEYVFILNTFDLSKSKSNLAWILVKSSSRAYTEELKSFPSVSLSRNGILFLYGGQYQSGQVLNETWIANLTNIFQSYRNADYAGSFQWTKYNWRQRNLPSLYENTLIEVPNSPGSFFSLGGYNNSALASPNDATLFTIQYNTFERISWNSIATKFLYSIKADSDDSNLYLLYNDNLAYMNIDFVVSDSFWVQTLVISSTGDANLVAKRTSKAFASLAGDKENDSIDLTVILSVVSTSFIFCMILVAGFIAYQLRTKKKKIRHAPRRSLKPVNELHHEKANVISSRPMAGFDNSYDMNSTAMMSGATVMVVDSLALPGHMFLVENRDFVLVKKISEGGLGNVFIGKLLNQNVRKELNLGDELCVIKLQKKANKSGMKELFQQEVAIMNLLKSSRFIVRLLGYSDDGVTRSIITTYYAEGSLSRVVYSHSKMSKDLWTAELLAGFMANIMEGLHFVHYKGIAHCDLKTDNILLHRSQTGALRCIICDFGLAYVSSDLLGVKAFHKSEIVGGSLVYMAPEVFERMKSGRDDGIEIMFKGDIYSIGIIIFELLVRGRPWSEIATDKEITEAVIRGERPKLKNIAVRNKSSKLFRTLTGIMEACWLQDPKARPSSSDILNELQNT